MGLAILAFQAAGAKLCHKLLFFAGGKQARLFDPFFALNAAIEAQVIICLLYTSDAADE